MSAFDPLGLLDFRAAADDDIAVWAFDLLSHNGRGVRRLPLMERKDLLMVLVIGAGDDRLRLCDGFDDGVELRPPPRRWGWRVWSRSVVIPLTDPELSEGENQGLARGQQGALAALRKALKPMEQLRAPACRNPMLNPFSRHC